MSIFFFRSAPTVHVKNRVVIRSRVMKKDEFGTVGVGNFGFFMISFLPVGADCSCQRRSCHRVKGHEEKLVETIFVPSVWEKVGQLMNLFLPVGADRFFFYWFVSLYCKVMDQRDKG